MLDTLDLSLRLEPADYKRKLDKWQDRLATLTDDRRFRDIAVVAAFEGSDAAGKGGAIRRVTAALDPRRFRVQPIAAPSDEEKAQPYLWRFWRRLPRKGHVAVFDRSWYGRVLVERVEGFAGEAEWLRAYGEIDRLREGRALPAEGEDAPLFEVGLSPCSAAAPSFPSPTPAPCPASPAGAGEPCVPGATGRPAPPL